MSPRALRTALALLLLATPCAAAPLHVRGRILDGNRGAGGISVEAVPELGPGEPKAVATARTGLDGFFDLAVGESGCYRVRVRTPGGPAVASLDLVEDADLPPLILPFRDVRDHWGWHAEPPPRGPAPAGEPRVLTGRVTATGGAPLAGALVWSTGAPWTAPVRTDGAGRFRIALPAGLRLDLRAAAAGHFPADPKPAEDGPVELALRPASAIPGRVEDEAGTPLAGVRVVAQAEGRFGLGVPPAWSGPDGRLRFAPVEPGTTWRLSAEAPDHAPASAVADAPPAGKAGAAVRLVLGRGRTLAGRLENGRGRPVVGGRVRLVPAEETVVTLDRETAVASGAEGAFEVRRLRPGLYRVSVEAKGFAPLHLPEVEVRDGAPRTDLGTLTLEDGAVLEGTVVEAAGGAPVEGAKVSVVVEQAVREFPGTNQREAVTGPDGGFRIEDLPVRRLPVLRVERPGYVGLLRSEVPVPSPEPLRFELRRGRVLTGRVVGPAGEPVPGADVVIEERTPTTSSSRTAPPAGPDGGFRLDDLGPEPVTLAVSAPGYGEQRVEVQPSEEPPAEPLRIVLSRSSAIEGRTLDAQGRPIPRAQVVATVEMGGPEQPSSTMESLSELADADGRFRFEMRAGRVRIFASDPEHGGAAAEGVLAPGATLRVDLVFKPGAEVSGRVVDEAGAPVPGALVALYPADPSGARPPLNTLAGAEGTFRFSSVVDGTYRLSVAAQGFADGPPVDTVKVGGAPLAGLEARLSRGATLTGRLLGLEPEELREARLYVRPRTPETPVVQTVIGADGTYTARNLLPGLWELTATTSGGRHATARIEIAPGQPAAAIDVTFEPLPPK